MPASLIVLGFAKGERNIAVFDHMLNLPPHRQRKQDDEIDHQHGPEYRHVEYCKPCAYKANRNRSRGRMPELELWQSSNKRPKFFVLLCRQAALAIFQPFILRQGWVEFWLQECEEEVQQVNSEGVANNVPALGKDYAHEK